MGKTLLIAALALLPVAAVWTQDAMAGPSTPGAPPAVRYGAGPWWQTPETAALQQQMRAAQQRVWQGTGTQAEADALRAELQARRAAERPVTCPNAFTPNGPNCAACPNAGTCPRAGSPPRRGNGRAGGRGCGRGGGRGGGPRWQ